MKKLFLSLVAAIVAATATYAQDVYVATLNHEGTITEYYGTYAFQTAYNAAVDGDIITLSEGVFNFDTGFGSQHIYITKSITIRGIGMSADNVHGIKQTTLSGIRGGKPDRIYLGGSNITVEGINSPSVYIRTQNSTCNKCKFANTHFDSSSNNTFTNCVISGLYHQPNSNSTFRNCYIGGNYYCCNATMFNCLLYYPSSYNSISENIFDNSNFTNCVIASSVKLPASNKAANSVGISLNTSNTTDIFVNMPEKLGCSMATTDIFSSWSDAIDATNMNPDSYELSELGLQYQGIDGTQIGMLGGNYPYNPIVSIPRITRCEVAEKATADGKLSVNIEVTAPTTE